MHEPRTRRRSCRNASGVAARASAALLAGAGVALAACGADPAPPAHLAIPGADAERGRALIAEAGCGSCHRIPGIRDATGRVGPPLDDFAARIYVAGVLPNVPQHLVAWLVDPPAISPRTAMPNLGLDERQARDVAAYLYRLGARDAEVYVARPEPFAAPRPQGSERRPAG